MDAGRCGAVSVLLLADGTVEVDLRLVGLGGSEACAGEGLEAGVWGRIWLWDDDAGVVVAGYGLGVDGGGGDMAVGLASVRRRVVLVCVLGRLGGRLGVVRLPVVLWRLGLQIGLLVLVWIGSEVGLAIVDLLGLLVLVLGRVRVLLLLLWLLLVLALEVGADGGGVVEGTRLGLVVGRGGSAEDGGEGVVAVAVVCWRWRGSVVGRHAWPQRSVHGRERRRGRTRAT